MHFSNWSIVQQVVYQKCIKDIDHLKKRIVQAWESISQEKIDK